MFITPYLAQEPVLRIFFLTRNSRSSQTPSPFFDLSKINRFDVYPGCNGNVLAIDGPVVMVNGTLRFEKHRPYEYGNDDGGATVARVRGGVSRLITWPRGRRRRRRRRRFASDTAAAARDGRDGWWYGGRVVAEGSATGR